VSVTHLARRGVLLAALSLGSVAGVRAQQRAETAAEPFTIADILSAPFPTGLVAAPDGRAVAWVADDQGRRNVWVAEAPAWRARRLTRYAEDDGQELSDLTWTADSRALLYTRGGDPGGNHDIHEPANPLSDPRGMEQAVWFVSLRGGTPRRLGPGWGAVPSPDGSRAVWIFQDTLRTAPLRSAGPARVLLKLRGASDQPAFAPDGRTLAFVSRRGDHSLIGLYDFAAGTVRWVAPGTFRDDTPRWSPDGRRLAYVRRPGAPYRTGPPLPPIAHDGYAPWSVRVADVATLEAYDLWRSPDGADGGYPFVAGDWVLQWADPARVLFASEQTGWIGLYGMDLSDRTPTRLTPTGCEIYDVVLTARRDAALYASNCGDIDRRHLQRVDVRGGPPQPITAGTGIEWSPAPLADGRVALLRSDARRPASPAIAGDEIVTLDGWPLPAAFPVDQLVEPQPFVVRAADSTEIHLQVFFPPDGAGRHPAMLFFHGGPVRQMLLGFHYMQYYHQGYAFNQYLASRGFIVVSVNYRGGVGYGRAFRNAPDRGRFGASEYQDVLAAADWLRRRVDVDTAHIGLWGGSYGGYLTALGLARNSDLFAAGFDLHGVHDYAEEVNAPRTFGVSDSALAAMRRASPIGSVGQWRSPVLLVQGDDDRNVQFQQTVDLALRLRRLGVHVEEMVFPDEIHDFLRHATWLAAYRAGAGFLVRELRR